MAKNFEVFKTKLSNVEEVTAILTRHLEAQELDWLKKNEINEFDCVELDLEEGEIKLVVSFVDCNI